VEPDRKSQRIVLVDDEQALAWSLASRLQKARPHVTVETAFDGETALARIAARPPDLVIADIRMPGMSGIDLIVAARRLDPDLPVIVMTAFRPADITRLEQGPFTGFLEKPFEFERLCDLVDEAFAPPTSLGFSGAISVQTLPDIVQLYVLSSASGRLVVRHGKSAGYIDFAQGVILNAVTADVVGDEAFHAIMMWPGGEFTMLPPVADAPRSVASNWQELLLESVRRIDEAGRTSPPDAVPTSGWTQAPPALDDREIDQAFEDYAAALDGVPTAPVPTIQPIEPTTESRMNIKDSLSKLTTIDGFVGAALVDSESGMLLGSEGGGGMNLEIAAAGNTEVVRAKRKTMNNLALKDGLEDMLISLSKQYHLLRPLRSRSTLFFYVVLDRQRANLAMARITLADVEKDLQV